MTAFDTAWALLKEEPFFECQYCPNKGGEESYHYRGDGSTGIVFCRDCGTYHTADMDGNWKIHDIDGDLSGLVKMPIVPGSIERVERPTWDDANPHPWSHLEQRDNYPIGMWNAKFEHPDTGEIHPMQLRAMYSNVVYDVEGLPRFSGNIGYDDSQVMISPQIYTEPEERKFVVTGVGTKDENRRKGMATALYDMAAKILANHGSRLMRTGDSQSPAAKGLWGDRTEWPVRDDL